MKLITPITDSIFKKLNEEELLLINELYLEMEKYKNVIDKIKEKVDYYKSAKYGTYDSDDILADLNYIFLKLLEEVE